MLIVSVGLYLIVSFLASSRLFHQFSLTKWIACFFLCTIFFNTLIIEILSLFTAINNPVLYLSLQALFCIACAVMLLDPRQVIFKQPFPKIHIKVERMNGVEIFLSILIFLILAGSLLVGFLAPISNSDSLHTHLPRIFYWLQHGSLAAWNSNTTAQVNYPIIIPSQGLWLFLFSHNESLFVLVQWFSMLVSACMIYEIAILLGAIRKQALFAALIGLSYPIILLQSFSLQGDVFVAAVLLSSIFFLLLHIQKKSSIFLFLSGICVALSLGVKQTAFLFLPVYGLVVLILLIKKSIGFKTVLYTGFISLVVFMLCSSFMLIQSFFGKEKSARAAFGVQRYSIPFSRGTSARGYATNIFRYTYQEISLDGFTGHLKLAAQNVKNEFFKSITGKLGLNLETHEFIPAGETDYFQYDRPQIINEDSAWFGPLSWLLLPVCFVIALIKRRPQARAYAISALGLYLVFFFSIAVFISSWSPTNGRYLVVPILVLTPLVYTVMPKRENIQNGVGAIFALMALYFSSSIILINDVRPIITQGSLYSFQYQYQDEINSSNKISKYFYALIVDPIVSDLVVTSPNRVGILESSYYEKLFFQNTREIKNIDLVNQNFSKGTPLYLNIDMTILEYSLFGVNRTRNLYPIQNYDDIPQGAYLFITNSREASVPSYYSLVAQNKDYSIFLNP